ncbi:hypothetical protein DdX_14187 [Ditylenchus destructor]|uniref:Uncharacterized protein n=1 Tax=Ditylenchus destructor TaxID=166010 RepID=A0AAD4MV37_9BILA|nr:hypothetical protein DdX_14187 [Ditylenchus destructor]
MGYDSSIFTSALFNTHLGDILPTAFAIFDDVHKMSREWIVKNNVIIIGIVAGFLNFVYFCLHVRSSAASANFTFFGFLTCVVLALGAIERKYKYTYWPFIAYSALDLFVTGMTLLAMAYVLYSNNEEYQGDLCRSTARCNTSDFDPKTDTVRHRMLLWNIFYLILSLVVNGFFFDIVLSEYRKAFPKSSDIPTSQIVELIQESSSPKQPEVEPEKGDEKNIELGNMKQD